MMHIHLQTLAILTVTFLFQSPKFLLCLNVQKHIPVDFILFVSNEQEYLCAVSFPKCDGGEVLDVCANLCQAVLDKCEKPYWGGLDQEFCNQLPTTQCTAVSTASIIGMVNVFILLFILLAFM